jgi:hypothetical protein
MSTQNPQPPIPPPVATSAPAPAVPKEEKKITVISHCSLFYWWPVWAVSFLMFIITALTGENMVTVPPKTEARRDVLVDVENGKEQRDAYILPKGAHIPPVTKIGDKLPNPNPPHLWMSPNKNLGVLFVAVLLLVIVITNIPLRGLWSVIVIVFVISVVIIFALLEWWETILTYLGFLDIRINAAGYLVIASILFVAWLVVILLFDRQVYMTFTPGQLRVCLEIGDAETAYDTTGMSIQKQRSDLFRHWILGLGSGDLIVKTAGASHHEFHMPNVLFIGRKVTEIEEMLRQRQVVAGKPTM